MHRDLAPPTPLAIAVAASALTLLLAASAWFWIARANRDADVATDEQFATAAQLVRKSLASGDAFALLPAWSAGQLWRFERAYTDKGVPFNNAFIPGDPLDPWDFDGFSRAWLLVTHGRQARVIPKELGKVLAHHELGRGATLTLVQLRASRTVYDFARRLSEAEVTRSSARGKRQACSWVGERYVCPGAWWRALIPGVNEVGNSRRRCVFAQPDPPGGVLRVLYPRLPDGRVLHGRFGNRLWAVRNEAGSDTVMRVLIGGHEKLRMVLKRGDFTYRRWRIELAPKDRQKPVELAFSAVDSAWRQVCFDARLSR